MNQMITESTLEEFEKYKQNYSALLFYWWLKEQYEDRPFTIDDTCQEYYRSKRTIQRYMVSLKKLNLVETARKGSWRQNKRFKIVEEQ